MVKDLPSNSGDVRDVGLILVLGRSPGGGHGNPLQYSCLENPHGQRSLAGCSPWGHKELDMTEPQSTHTVRPDGYECRLWSQITSGPAGASASGHFGVQLRLTGLQSPQDPLGLQLWDIVGFSRV